MGYEFQFYCGGSGHGLKRRDSREETLANIMRQRSTGEQVSRISQSVCTLQDFWGIAKNWFYIV
jgi:hypothetical protein